MDRPDGLSEKWLFACTNRNMRPKSIARSKNISTKGPRNRRSLRRFACRDDKGEGDGSIKSRCWTEAFFITLGGPQAHDYSVEKHFHERSAELQIPPLRFASVGMTKGWATVQ